MHAISKAAGVSAIIALTASGAHGGSGPLFPGARYDTGSGPSSVAIGDLNGDQVSDLAVATYGTYPAYDGAVSVLLGVGDGTFAAAVDYAAGDAPGSVTIGDLNGDQVPDLAVADGGRHPAFDGSVSVLLGIGDGTFAPAVHYAAGSRARSVAISDLNGDHVPDLAVANWYSDNVSVLLGAGDGTFAAAVDYAVGERPRSLAIGDLNGDQVPDLAVANGGRYTTYDGSVSVLLGVGDGTFAAAINYPTGENSGFVAIGDLDGDQVPDLAVATSVYSGSVSLLLGVGDGTFSATVEYDTGNGARSVAIGDLDGDHVPDLAVANLFSDTVSVLLGVVDGTFAAALSYAAGDGPLSVVIGDLDGDHVPDLVVANMWSDNVSVLLGLGDGTFVAAVRYATGNWPTSVAIDDMDGDQVPDLAVANANSDNVSVLLGVGDGTFAAAVNYAAGHYARSVAIGDLDGDRVPDLAVANRGTLPTYDGKLSVLLGLGDGTFAAAVGYAVGDWPSSVAIGDLDGDQVPDLVVTNRGTWPNEGTVSVLQGLGDGTFAAAVHYAAGDYPRSVAIGDLDGDKVPDLAVANYWTGNVSVLLGVGDGTFAAAVGYAAGWGPASVAIGDLNGDQVPDLAVANGAAHSDSVSVLLGLGDGTFAAAVNFAAGDMPTSLAIGDLDGDGHPDLAVTHWTIDNVSVLLNQSSTPGDIDGDDDVDLSDFALFAGCMTGPENGAHPQGCDPFDFDGDFDVDLADMSGFQRAFGPIP